MPRHSFVQMTKLTDVRGRVDYITNPKRQEHLYATYSSVKPEFWELLSKQSQFDFWRSHQSKGKCIEGRELVIALPEHLQQEDPERLLQEFTKAFQDRYGMQCTSALHHNKAKTNYHIHLVFSERELLEKPEIKIASRNMFFDEEHRHVRTKKQILDENGNVRPGCIILRKGLPYEMRYFSERKDKFKERSFLPEVKEMYTELINQHARSEQDKQKVFDKAGPYLPTKKIGKNNPMADEIRRDNELRTEWNQSVDQLLIAGVTKEEVVEFKHEQVTSKVAQSIRENGRKPGLFAEILRKAIDVLRRYLKILMRFQIRTEVNDGEKVVEQTASVMDEPPVETETDLILEPVDPNALEHAQAQYLYLKNIHDNLDGLNRKAFAISKTIDKLTKQLSKLSGSILHIFERRDLEKQIASEKAKFQKIHDQIQFLPKAHGFNTVNDFETAFRTARSEYEDLQTKDAEYREWEEVSRQNAMQRNPPVREEVSEKPMEDKSVTTKETSRERMHDAPNRTGTQGHRTTSSRVHRSYGQKKSVLTRLAEKQELVDERKQYAQATDRRTDRQKSGTER